MQANCVFFSFAFDENVRDRNALKPTTHYSSGEMIIHFTSSFYFESGASKANRFAVPQLHCNCIGPAWLGSTVWICNVFQIVYIMLKSGKSVKNCHGFCYI